MKNDKLRQLAGIDHGWRRVVKRSKELVTSWYRTIMYIATASLLIVLIKLRLVRK